ncbi:MAG: hypothetical protein M3442_12605 [Chloroflexota bacterium]|nr:hypothetical protein [Chloroflexota bacterium]
MAEKVGYLMAVLELARWRVTDVEVATEDSVCEREAVEERAPLVEGMGFAAASAQGRVRQPQ